MGTEGSVGTHPVCEGYETHIDKKAAGWADADRDFLLVPFHHKAKPLLLKG